MISSHARKKLATVKQDSGISLIEILVALLITTLIAIVIARVTMDASAGLTVAAEESVSSQQSLLFGQTLQYDIRASSDLYVYGATKPADSTNLCTSATDSTWTPANSTFVRPLFTVLVNDISYNKSFGTLTSTTAWTPATTKWVGYELRRTDIGTNNVSDTFEIWRGECANLNGAPDTWSPATAAALINLGDTFCSDSTGSVFLGIANSKDVGRANCPNRFSGDASFAPAGNTVLYCGDYTSLCATGTSTATNSTYSFTLPYAGCRLVLVSITNNASCTLSSGNGKKSNSLSQITRRVG